MSRRCALALLALLVTGCEKNSEVATGAGSVAGGVGGVAIGGLTSNPAVGYAIGLALRSAVSATLGSWFRSLRHDEQEAIATAAGEMQPGESRLWKIEHGLPFGWQNAKGRMEVTRVIENPLADCREVMFSLAGGKPADPPEGIFIATTCRQAEGWKWATAEPAVERWGALQ
ncbi:hypothetical protein QMO56_20470 [Roseomonas sp. E05]|uniref:hypothetical protein n=1 Tax=Roseomonas sp. E05 TaxID=3046310 RepID=UPI0024BA61BB|nr:hypothetical protein [Roseomonas sp. E05]MDJ0390490.1 hypothetical protein [Roseomonas sp. E05]